MTGDAGSVQCYGKIPTHGDFVRHQATSPEVQALDAWLRDGLFAAKMRRLPNYDAAYDAAPTWSFVFSPARRGTALVGCLHMSRDHSGRKYPLLVSTQVSDVGAGGMAPPHLPLRMAPFLRDAAALTEAGARGDLSYEDLTDRLRRMEVRVEEDEVGRSYEAGLRKQTLGDLLQRASSDESAESSSAHLVKDLQDVLDGYRGEDLSRFALTLAFPLTDASAAKREVGFWMEVCMRWLDHTPDVPTLFWTRAEEPRLLLSFRAPGPTFFLHLLGLAHDDDRYCRMGRMSRGEEAALTGALSPERRALLEEGRESLWALLHQL